jgi:predicted ABC-type ATPase
MARLVVITGPIGSGKSSVAGKLAESVKNAGRTAVVVDLDDTVATMHIPPGDVDKSWESARVVHGRLVGVWLPLVDTVVVDGPFYSKTETSTMMRHVPTGVLPRRVLLLANYEVALERVASDLTRGASKIPSVLRTKYEEFERQLPSLEPCDWTFDTLECSVDDIVSTIARGLEVG